MSRSNVSSDQLTKPSGAFLRWIFFCFLGSSPAFSTARRFSMTWSGAWATTQPRASKPARPGPSDDLVELARLEHALLRPVELRQAGEQHGADRHVDADAERVGAADDLEQAVLRELLDEAAVLRQHPRVVHADAVPDEPRERAAEAGPEAEAADAGGDRLALLARRDLDGHEALGPLEGGRLREVDDVDRRAVLREQLLDGLVEGRHGIRELEGDGALGAGDDGRGAAGAPGQVVPEHRDVAEGGRHEDELRLRQLDDRDLPRPAAVGLGVEVELVHDDETHVSRAALPQREVREDLGRAADDRGVGVDRRVAGDHADVVGAELLAEGEELLGDERLDRRGVEADAVLGERGEVGRGGDERLPRAGRASTG